MLFAVALSSSTKSTRIAPNPRFELAPLPDLRKVNADKLTQGELA
jgi:hypothetical protein